MWENLAFLVVFGTIGTKLEWIDEGYSGNCRESEVYCKKFSTKLTGEVEYISELLVTINISVIELPLINLKYLGIFVFTLKKIHEILR